MKMIKYIISLIVLTGCMVSCTDNSIDNLHGAYSDIVRYTYTSASAKPTTKLKKGIKQLNITLSDASGNDAVFKFGSKEWTLASGTYTAVSTIVSNLDFGGTIGGKAISSGSIDVNAIDSTYYFNGLLTLSDNSKVVINYKGKLSFKEGIDDPEASGYTFAVVTGSVTLFDGTTHTSTIVDGVTQYAFTIKDESGKPIALINTINNPDLTTNSLIGTYTVSSSAASAQTAGAGYCYPTYNIAGGTCYTDDSGIVQYITAGTITISTTTDSDGKTLYTFSGSNLSTISATGTTVTGNSFKITYATIE